jgi:hypothetical protein
MNKNAARRVDEPYPRRKSSQKNIGGRAMIAVARRGPTWRSIRIGEPDHRFAFYVDIDICRSLSLRSAQATVQLRVCLNSRTSFEE